MSYFSDRVKEVMLEKGINQKDLSFLSGVSESSLCRYLKGQVLPRMDIIINVSKGLGVSVDYLQGKSIEKEGGDPYCETRNVVFRNKNQLTSMQKAEIINMLFEKDEQ